MRTFPRKLLAILLATLLMASSAAVLIQALEPYGNNVKIRNWVRNDPDYTFSDAYKTSVWYENFSSLSLTENHRNNVLRIAVSQLGYHEGNSAADFDGKNTAGTGNYIEYARLIVPNYNDNHYEWCACFVNWCLNQARIDYCYGEIGCWKWVEWLKANGMFEDSKAYGGKYAPQPADMIFFNWDETNTTSGHIGYVLYTAGNTVYTIEGNSQNEVGLRSYSLDAKCIIGYGTPPYDEVGEPTLDYSYAKGMPTGKYVVTSATATLTGAPANSPKITKLTLGSTVTLLSVEGSYAYVSVEKNDETKLGYVPTKYLCLMTPENVGHTVTFVADGQEIGKTLFKDPTESVTPPEVPQKDGYTGAWENFTLGNEDITVNAVYTPIEYTVTFTADGQVVNVATYTVEKPSVALPAVPEKEGYTGAWENFTLSTGDMTVNAVYTQIQTGSSTEIPTDPATQAPTEAPTQVDRTETPTQAPVTEAAAGTNAPTPESEKASVATSSGNITDTGSASESGTEDNSNTGCTSTAGLCGVFALLTPMLLLFIKRRKRS